MPRSIAAVMVAAALLLPGPPPAVACSCGSSAYVGDRYYVGYGARAFGVRPTGRVVDLVHAPCCEYDASRGEARAIAGLPPRVAVLDGGTLYIEHGQLLQLAGHPLHPEDRDIRGRECRPGPTVRARTRGEADSHRLLTRSGRRVGVGSATRLTNRPVTASLRTGQRLRATTSRCENGLFAKELTFVGGAPQPGAPELAESSGSRLWWFAGGVACLLGLGAWVRYTRTSS